MALPGYFQAGMSKCCSIRNVSGLFEVCTIDSPVPVKENRHDELFSSGLYGLLAGLGRNLDTKLFMAEFFDLRRF